LLRDADRVPEEDEIGEVAGRIKAAKSWNARVALIRKIPEDFGKAQHQEVYAAVAETVFVPQLAPDFAYVHWRDEYEIQRVEEAYEKAYAKTAGFTQVAAADLIRVLNEEPSTLLIFRLLLGFTPQEFAAATSMTAEPLAAKPLSTGAVGSMEAGAAPKGGAAEVLAALIDRGMRGVLFPAPGGSVRSKIDKPDTLAGWATVHKYAETGVPLAVLLHQRHYGGTFGTLLNATSTQRGDLLEDAVEALFTGQSIRFLRTGSGNQEMIAQKFGLTVKPAPDFVVYDARETLRAILECKQVNDGGTARDKAARFRSLREEAMRLGGVPVFAILAGLGWRRTQDALGPVVRDTDGRVFTAQSLAEMMEVDPFPSLRAEPGGA
jgi:hypothetical protein